MEIWKDVKGFEGLYQVSNYGNVKSKRTILKPSTRKDGRKQVVLSKNGKKSTFKIHRLVAIAFIENPLNLKEINHKDEDPANNNVNNLEWCDRMYNQHYGTAIERMSKSMIGKALGSKSVLSKKLYQFTLNGEFIKEWESLYDANRTLKISPYNICSCCSGKRISAGGYKWSHNKY